MIDAARKDMARPTRRFVRSAAATVLVVAGLTVVAGFTEAVPAAEPMPPEAVATESLWRHVRGSEQIRDTRQVAPDWHEADGGRLTLRSGISDTPSWSWATIPAPAGGWDLTRRAAVEATIVNRGASAVEVALWVVGERGMDASGDFHKLAPGESRPFSCTLRPRFPDGTPALDPRWISGVRVMLTRPPADTTLDVTSLVATGDAPPWQPIDGRLEPPPIEEGAPAAGRRVRRRLSSGADTGLHHLLYLPIDWRPGRRYPVVVEYPGNVHFVPGCYSTGLPDQCVIGYGMSRGEGTIWLSMPFVDRGRTAIVENGWGDPDDTADYCVDVVEDVCARFGGDRDRVVLTGFSRGAIACGYIGLGNDRIAALWRGFHVCQHFDGDGWGGADMAGAVGRARRFRGRSVFHTDNPEERVRPVTEALGVPSIFVASGLGGHATAMFLDDRPSTQSLRRWYGELTEAKP